MLFTFKQSATKNDGVMFDEAVRPLVVVGRSPHVPNSTETRSQLKGIKQYILVNIPSLGQDLRRSSRATGRQIIPLDRVTGCICASLTSYKSIILDGYRPRSRPQSLSSRPPRTYLALWHKGLSYGSSS